MEKIKGNRGITLVALVVTIIVLIILAGISMRAIRGDSGIIKQATEAQILTELSNVKEALEIYKIQEHNDGDMSNEELVEDIIYQFLYRAYEPNGKGGLFYIRDYYEDLRNVEIWTQLCWYLDNFD